MGFLNKEGLEHLWAQIVLKLSGKVDVIPGKGLSTNDYTTSEKNKLAGVAEGANKTVVDDAMSDTSANPVQNKVVSAAIDNIIDGYLGNKTVSKSIEDALDGATADDFGIYVQSQEPANAVAGDIWIDTMNDPSYMPPTLPEITAADNGKMLMVVNGKLQLVSLNLSIDANGVVSA